MSSKNKNISALKYGLMLRITLKKKTTLKKENNEVSFWHHGQTWLANVTTQTSLMSKIILTGVREEALGYILCSVILQLFHFEDTEPSGYTPQ